MKTAKHVEIIGCYLGLNKGIRGASTWDHTPGSYLAPRPDSRFCDKTNRLDGDDIGIIRNTFSYDKDFGLDWDDAENGIILFEKRCGGKGGLRLQNTLYAFQAATFSIQCKRVCEKDPLPD